MPRSTVAPARLSRRARCTSASAAGGENHPCLSVLRRYTRSSVCSPSSFMTSLVSTVLLRRNRASGTRLGTDRGDRRSCHLLGQDRGRRQRFSITPHACRGRQRFHFGGCSLP